MSKFRNRLELFWEDITLRSTGDKIVIGIWIAIFLVPTLPLFIVLAVINFGL